MGLGRVLMLQGTGSSVGKTLLCVALLRLFRRAGLAVAPFKAQNTTRETARAACGGEIAVAQAVQAAAAGLAPTVDLNPVVLRPSSTGPLRLLVHGQPAGTLEPADYAAALPRLRAVAAASLARLRARYDLVVIEGAGSPVETPCPADDLANMGLAALAGAPVLLVADVDRGGAAAAIVGTLVLLGEADRARVAGLLLNRLRGEPGAFAPEASRLARAAGRPVFGVVPHLGPVALPAEDGLDNDEGQPAGARRLSAEAAPGLIEAECDRLADLVAPHLALDRIAALCRLPAARGPRPARRLEAPC